MTDIDVLNRRFALADELRFEMGEGGLAYAKIENGFGAASICLQGGHLLTWQPHAQHAPVVWLSDHAQFAPGKSIRGGVPVCWPWFGPRDANADYPAHGFVRTAPWQVRHAGRGVDGATDITLTPVLTDTATGFWPYRTELTLRIQVGDVLRMTLTTANRDDREVVIGEALHTYFHVGDIAETRVCGLDQIEYLDKLQAYARCQQAGAIGFAGETDRVYVDTDSPCVIEDPVLQRRIVIAKSGSLSTVVWTPWADRAAQMGDLGPEGWRRMVCVESANAKDNLITVGPGGEHSLTVEYAVEALV